MEIIDLREVAWRMSSSRFAFVACWACWLHWKIRPFLFVWTKHSENPRSWASCSHQADWGMPGALPWTKGLSQNFFFSPLLIYPELSLWLVYYVVVFILFFGLWFFFFWSVISVFLAVICRKHAGMVVRIPPQVLLRRAHRTSAAVRSKHKPKTERMSGGETLAFLCAGSNLTQIVLPAWENHFQSLSLKKCQH